MRAAALPFVASCFRGTCFGENRRPDDMGPSCLPVLGADAIADEGGCNLGLPAVPGATSEVLAAQLVGKWTNPCERALREDLRRRVLEVLEAMEPNDREVLCLRHFEQLSNAEAALDELGIHGSAASKRYLRALARLKEAFAAIPGGAARWL